MADSTSLDKCLQKIDYMFRWTGMNLESSQKNPSQNKKYKYFFIFTFLWVEYDVVGAICWLIDGVKKQESLTSLTYVTPCIAISFLGNLKSYVFFIHEKPINDLIATLRRLEAKNIQRLTKGDETSVLIKKEMKFLNSVLKIQNYVTWGLIVSFSGMPFIAILSTYIESNKIELVLPLLVMYPFDAFNLKVWPFIFAAQAYAIMLVSLEVCGADSFFYVCCSFIHIQFRLLQQDFEDLIPNHSMATGVVEDCAEIRRTIAKLIDWHQQLIRCVELVEKIYTKSTLFNFVSSSTLICLTGFNVTTIDDMHIAFVVSFLSFLFMSLLQIFFLCYFGDTLLKSSVAVSNGVYNSKWYLADPKISKILLYILARSHKPCKLTACGFAEVNLMAFTKILSTAWSYFALLKTVYNSPK